MIGRERQGTQAGVEPGPRVHFEEMTMNFNKDACERRMLNGEKFTYREMKATFTDNDDMYRDVDKTIQRLRRAGKISFVRDGRDCVWLASLRTSLGERPYDGTHEPIGCPTPGACSCPKLAGPVMPETPSEAALNYIVEAGRNHISEDHMTARDRAVRAWSAIRAKLIEEQG